MVADLVPRVPDAFRVLEEALHRVAGNEEGGRDGMLRQEVQDPLHPDQPELPREIGVGEVIPRAIQIESASKS